ncbi:uncharacterized protein LOC142590224 [Dermacentor variabilis]|uniref:uncharacterized protein LOC142590224 n=1 Tax=Dermacentor variabilis TaxID=34621 RepID=UPI003F5BC908
MHAYSLWWKLLAASHRAPSQAKAKTRSKTKTRRDKREGSSAATPQEGHGPRKAPVPSDAPGASGDGVIGTVLGAVGVRRRKVMTSRSRVGGKYKVNNQNLEKFEQILSKIPEGEKTKATLSSASLPERRDDACRTPVQQPVERPGPDISPSATMGSSVTAEYELFCKAFHSEAKQLLPDEEQKKPSMNPMRQLLQQASEAAAKGLQLQRVTTAAGSPPGFIPGGLGRRAPETESQSGRGPPAFVASMAASAASTPAPPAPIEAPPGGQNTDSVTLLVELAGLQEQPDGQNGEDSGEVQQQPEPEPLQKPQHSREPRPQRQQRQKHSRRWSENPVGAPIFMARKFAEKLRRSMEVGTSSVLEEAVPSTSASHGGNAPPPRRKSSASSQSHAHKQTALPKTSAASSKQTSLAPAVKKKQHQSPAATSREFVGQAESTYSTSSKRRGKRKRKIPKPTEDGG